MMRTVSFLFLRIFTFIVVLFKGIQCEFDLSKCDEYFPCQNNGTCSINPNNSSSLICNCPPGFSGERCEEDVSVCSTQVNPCQNGATCVDGLGIKFNCICMPGWEGKLCEKNIDECAELPCHNGGICLDQINGFSCACPFGFTGKTCETELKVCTENPCKNDGFCLEEDGKNVCYCVPDFHGKFCEEQYDECKPEPQCFNGGTCIDGIGGFNCSCPPGFYGVTCECTEPDCHLPTDNMTLISSTFITTEMPSTLSISLTPILSTSFHTDHEVTPTISMGGDASSSEWDSVVTSGSRVSSLSVVSSQRSDEIWQSEIPSMTYSPDVEYSSYYSPGEPIFSTSSMDATTTTMSTIPFGRSSPMVDYSSGHSSDVTQIQTTLTPSYDFESSMWESYGITKVFTPTDSGVLQTRFPVSDLESSELVPPIETAFVTLVIPSSDFPAESSDFSFESSLPIYSFLISSSISESNYFNSTRSNFPLESTSILTTSLPYISIILQTPFATDTPDMQSEFQSEESIRTSIYSTSLRSTFQIDFTPDLTHSLDDSSVPFTPSIHTDYLSSTLSSTIHIPPPLTVSYYPSDSDSQDASLYSSLWSQLYSDGVLTMFEPLSPTEFVTTYFPTLSTSIQQSLHTSPLIPFTPSVSSVLVSSQGSPSIEDSSSFIFPITETQIMPADTESLYYSDWSTVSIDIPVMSPPIETVGPSGSDVSTILQLSPSLTTFRGPISPSATTSQFIETSTPITSSSLPEITPRPTPTLESSDSFVFETDYSISKFSTDGIIPITPSPTEILPTATPTIPLPTNLTDPCLNYCLNNAKKCISNSIGPPVCMCHFKFTGIRCELEREKVNFPSFKGNSFLSYEVPQESVRVLDISMKMTTLIPDGIIMYSGAPNGKIYAFIFAQSGLLTLHFSCGSQSMHFVETRTRIDNGYNFTIHFRMEMVVKEKSEVHCVGELRVNGSYVMMGEQVVGQQRNMFNTSATASLGTIFIGGVPSEVSTSERKPDHLLPFLSGFRGCIYELLINEELRDMFDDAADGKDISECGTLACLVNPCFGGATCFPKDGYPAWECLCPTGFVGTRCQIPVCRYNPCLNGATCATTTSKTIQTNNTNSNDTLGESSRCLCTLGFTGSLCQNRVKIQKPSFHPTNDYASFVSFDDIPDLGDWFQLKFHFVTRNMSQIALLMYIGNKRQTGAVEKRSLSLRKTDNFLENGSDFFALSFLQGFIAATWNLGTGTQRIITPSRIDSRLEIHTLFVGRQGRYAWIKVDGMRNMTGKTVGPLYRLNVNTDLFIGGYESFQFEGLPHDLPMHYGFQGCIFDLGFRVKNYLYLPNATAGRNVKNCFEEDC